MQELSERLKQIRTFHGLSQEKFSASLGLKQGSYSDIERGRVKALSESVLMLLKINYNINPKWVNNEIGSMFLEKTSGNAKSLDEFDYINVPLVPVRGKAGYLAGYGDFEYLDSLSSRQVIVDREYKGKYLCFEVDGDSMDDGTRESICDRDIVLGREVKRELWKNKLHIRDWNFIIVHRDGISIKRIIDHNLETNMITCHSLNPLYDDFELSLEDVVELYNLIKIVDRSARR
jgi:transcriptional regulator with XRE-family HTH domain